MKKNGTCCVLLKDLLCYLYLNTTVQKKEKSPIKIAPSNSEFQDFNLASKTKCVWHSVLFSIQLTRNLSSVLLNVVKFE